MPTHDIAARRVAWIGLGVLIAGAVFLAGGGLLVAGVIRGRGASQARTA